MHLRPLQPGDFDDLLRIWNESAVFDPLTPALLEEKLLGDDDVVLEHCVVVEQDQRPIGFSVPVLRQSADGPRGFVKLFAVAPASRRQGIGRMLLSRCEETLRAAGAITIRPFESAPNYLVPGIDMRYNDALQFVRSCGYQQVGETSNLSVDLRVPVEPVAAELGIRRATTADREALHAFLQPRWPTWFAEIESTFDTDLATLFIAERGARVIGFAAYDANNRNTGWFGPMGVATEARGSGVGCGLLRSCLVALQEQGRPVATIPWVGPVPFYEKCADAKLARRFARFEKALN